MIQTKKNKNKTFWTIPSFGGFIQIDVKSGSPSENMAKVKQYLARLCPPEKSIVVLPELWSAGFFYEELEKQAAQTDELLAELGSLCSQYKICLAGSLPEKKEGMYFNTLYFCGPDGLWGKYRKQQLFGPMEEDQYFKNGSSPSAIISPWGMVSGLVCYDLRFAELARSQAAQGAAILVVSAQWPKSRKDHWRILLQARAIENQSFVLACNRCGVTDETEFAGHSMIIGPDGKIIAEAADEEAWGGAPLDQNVLVKVRSRFHTAGKTPYRFSDKDKICDIHTLRQRAFFQKNAGRKMVFTNGCFDILHEGHVTYLEAARREGDYLVVGLNSDDSIKKIKGPGRPVNSEKSRARLLAALGCVDYVVLFEEDTPHGLISSLLPDVLVKGADWPVEEIVGAAEVLAGGGEVKTIKLVGEFSTTGLIEKIRSK